MAAMSDYLEGQLIAHIFRTASFTKPTVLAATLLTTSADDTDTGTFAGPGVEVTNAGSYARVDRPPLDANWAAPGVGGLTDNVADIAFTQATASWTTVNGMALCSSATWGAGEVYVHGALASAKLVDNGDTFKFPIGDLDITLA